MPAALARPLSALAGVALLDPGRLVNALEWSCGVRKQELRDFIAFCRQGGFAVCPQGGAIKLHDPEKQRAQA